MGAEKGAKFFNTVKDKVMGAGRAYANKISVNGAVEGRLKNIVTADRELAKKSNNAKMMADSLDDAIKMNILNASGNVQGKMNMIAQKEETSSARTIMNLLGNHYSGMQADGTKSVGTAAIRVGTSVAPTAITIGALHHKREKDIGGSPY